MNRRQDVNTAIDRENPVNGTTIDSPGNKSFGTVGVVIPQNAGDAPGNNTITRGIGAMEAHC